MNPPMLGRREANKARTREAIIEALAGLMALRPLTSITVDQVAEAAGISRRTFFNYFASIQAVVSEVIGDHTAPLVASFPALDPASSAIGQLRCILTHHRLPIGLLRWLRLAHCSLDGDTALERTVWQEKSVWLQQELSARLPDDVDPLYLATLSATVMTCFAIAEEQWFALRGTGAPVDDAAVTAFHQLLDRALAHAEHGWNLQQTS